MVFADFGGADDVAFRKYVVEPFEKKYGGTVTLIQGLTFDILAKLNASKSHPTVDAWELTDAGTQTAVNEGLVQPLTAQTVPNINQLVPAAIHSMPGGDYVDYSFAGLPIVYNKSKIKTAPTSWSDLGNPAYKGHVLIPNVNSGVFPNILAVLSHANGGTTSNVDPAFTELKKLKPNVLTFYSDMDQPASLLTNGSAWIGIWPSDRATNQIQHGADLGIVYPNDGNSPIGDAIGVTKGTAHLAMAEAFVNYALGTASDTGLCSYMVLAPSNKSVKLPANLQQYLPTTAQLAASVSPNWAVAAKQIPAWSERFQQQIIGG